MPKLQIENVKTELSIKQWVLLSTKYTNLNTDLEMLCPEGHKVFMPLKQWRKKAECPTCSDNIYNTLNEIVSIQKKAGKKRILILDDSTTTTGWAVFDDQDLVGYGKIQMTQKHPVERIAALKQWMLSMLVKWQPDRVAIEDIQKQENMQIFKVLGHLQGVLINALYEHKTEYDIVHAATWRSYCEIRGGNRSDLKKNAQKKVKEWYDVSVTQDEADAICMGKFITNKYNKDNEFTEWET